jgi:hypothetical protein
VVISAREVSKRTMPTIVSMTRFRWCAPKSLSVSRVAVFLLLVSASGCHLLFGDYEVDPNYGQGGAVGSGGDTGVGGEGECTTGLSQCFGALLKQCVDGKWVDGRTCSAEKLCNRDKSRCDTCASGDKQCNDSGAVEKCDTDLNDWVLDTQCVSPQFCDPKTYKCVDCEAGVVSCIDATTLGTCTATQVLVTTNCSGQVKLCRRDDDTHAHCVDCQGSSSVCDGQNIRTCSNEQYVVVDTCGGRGCQTVNGVPSCK